MEPKFSDYLGTLGVNMDYASYLVKELAKEGKSQQLSSHIGAYDIVEIEDEVIALIDKIQKVRGKRQ